MSRVFKYFSTLLQYILSELEVLRDTKDSTKVEQSYIELESKIGNTGARVLSVAPFVMTVSAYRPTFRDKTHLTYIQLDHSQRTNQSTLDHKVRFFLESCSRASFFMNRLHESRRNAE